MELLKQPAMKILGKFTILLILTYMVGLNMAAGSDYMISHLMSGNKEKPLPLGNVPIQRGRSDHAGQYEHPSNYGPRYPMPGNTTNSTLGAQSPAEDKIFFPPYKFPFWGLPYGISSKGGLFNPGLFPFVPGGPAFPPFDGIFGGPFGPGHFPGGGPEPFQGPGNYAKEGKPDEDSQPKYKGQNMEQEYDKPKKNKKKKKKKPCCTTTTSTSTTPSTTTGSYDDSYHSPYYQDMPPEPNYFKKRYPPPRNYGYPPPRNYYNSYGSGRSYSSRRRPPPPSYESMRSYYNDEYYHESSTTPSTTTTTAYSTTAAPATNPQTIMYLSPGYQPQPLYTPPVYPALNPQSPYGPVTVQNFYGAQGYNSPPSYPYSYAPHQPPPMHYPSPYAAPPPYQHHQPQYLPYPYPIPPQMPFQNPYGIITAPTASSTTTTPTTTTPYTTTTTTSTTTQAPYTTTTTPAPTTSTYTTTTQSPITTTKTSAPTYYTAYSASTKSYHSLADYATESVKPEIYSGTSETQSPYYMLSKALENQYYITSTTPASSFSVNYGVHSAINKSSSTSTLKPGKMYTLVDIDYFRDNKINPSTANAPNVQNYYIQMPSTPASSVANAKLKTLAPTFNPSKYSDMSTLPIYHSSATTELPIEYPFSTSVSKTVSQKLFSGDADYKSITAKPKEEPKNIPSNKYSTSNYEVKPIDRISYITPVYKSTTTQTPDVEYEEYEVFEDYLIPDSEPEQSKSKSASRSGRSFSIKSPGKTRHMHPLNIKVPRREIRIFKTRNNHLNGTNIFLAPNSTIVLSNQRVQFKPDSSQTETASNFTNSVAIDVNASIFEKENETSESTLGKLNETNSNYSPRSLEDLSKNPVNQTIKSYESLIPHILNYNLNNSRNHTQDELKDTIYVNASPIYTLTNITSEPLISNTKFQDKIYQTVKKYSESSSIRISEKIHRPKKIKTTISNNS